MGHGRLGVERTHIKALLSNPQMREWIRNRLRDKRLVSADTDNLSPSAFGDLHDAALNTFGNEQVPVAKLYYAEGSYGDYQIQIVGVPGAYLVTALESDDVGFFGTLEEAENYVGVNWWGEAREVG